jgi:hypothetical protein
VANEESFYIQREGFVQCKVEKDRCFADPHTNHLSFISKSAYRLMTEKRARSSQSSDTQIPDSGPPLSFLALSLIYSQVRSVAEDRRPAERVRPRAPHTFLSFLHPPLVVAGRRPS